MPLFVPAPVSNLKSASPILHAILSQRFPHKILQDFKLEFLRSPFQLINSMVYAQATNPRFKPRKEKLYGQELMYFTDYLHQLAKENMKTVKSLDTQIQDEKDGNHGFFDCTEFLQHQDSLNVDNLVERLQSVKDVGLIHPLEKNKVISYDRQGNKVKSYYRSMVTKGVLHKPVLQVYRNIAFIEHQLVHWISPEHVFLHQIIRTHYPLPFNDMIQLEVMTECHRTFQDPTVNGLTLNSSSRLHFMEGKATAKLNKEVRDELEDAYAGVLALHTQEYVSNGLHKWFTQYDIQPPIKSEQKPPQPSGQQNLVNGRPPKQEERKEGEDFVAVNADKEFL